MRVVIPLCPPSKGGVDPTILLRIVFKIVRVVIIKIHLIEDRQSFQNLFQQKTGSDTTSLPAKKRNIKLDFSA